MIVGIDVHKQSHAAAIIDERGAVIATLTIANSRDGARRLRRWLSEHAAAQATVGVENAAGYGRLVCAVLAAAVYEVLNVPAWRVHRERPQEGPGKSDPGDAVAIAVSVLRHREKLGPALEPPLIRAIALLETHRRQLVTRRTDAIQRQAARSGPNPRAFLARKIAEGKTKREARRTLKRHLSDIVYRRLHTWAQHALPPPQT